MGGHDDRKRMTKNLLIVGAGPGFSQATARRFGSEGWTVHLVARRQSRLDELAAELKVSDVPVTTHQADVTQHAELSELIREIDDQVGVDACIFQPGPSGDDLVDVLEATVANSRQYLELLTLGALAVGEALVPRMVARGSGTLVIVGGGSARLSLRMFGNLGPAMAGMRNYALTLHAALADTPVHVAFYTVSGMIATAAVGPNEIDPGQLTDRMWSLITEHDAREVIMTAKGEIVPKGAA
jgi:NADP-dependent 3-hydroxy acid dehydrogenase YdfG